MGVQWPVVVMPSGVQLLIDLLSAHPNLPAALAGKVSATLPDTFPAGLPYLQVRAVPGASSRPIPNRLGETAFDLHCYAATEADAELYARTVAGITQSLVGASTANGGITDVTVTEPFPLPDVTTAERWIVSAVITYRPL